MGWFGGKSTAAVVPKTKKTNNHSSRLKTSGRGSSPKRETNNMRIIPPAQSYADEETTTSYEMHNDTMNDQDTASYRERVFSYEQATYAESELPQTVENQNHVNSLFNGHLMKWKFDAEEGTIFVRLPAFIGAVSALVISGAAFIWDQTQSATAQTVALYLCILLLSVLVLVLDGRFVTTYPLGARSRLRNIVTQNFSILRFLWGRGFLYASVGTLLIGQMWIPSLYVGIYLIIVGVLALAVGIHASRKFATLRNSLADESYLVHVFSLYDSDGNGYIEATEFSMLLMELGVELDDRHTLKAFHAIDTDGDRLISFEDFSDWWTSGFVERGRKLHGEHDEESYRQMES